MASDRILHIAQAGEWAAAAATGAYRRSTLDRTLEEVGFIHCARAEQVAGVANALYRGRQGLVLLVIDRDAVRAPVRDDPVGDDTYPHIYGPLNPDAVVRVVAYDPGPDGRFGRPPT